MTEHDVRILAPKLKSVSDSEVLAEYARSHPWCAACGAGYRPLQIHHVIGGRGGRSDEECNLLRLCGHPCHLLAERLDVRGPIWTHRTMGRMPGDLLPKLTLGIQLSLKLRLGELSPADFARLEKLHGRTLPEFEPVPEWFAAQWKSNRPELTYFHGRVKCLTTETDAVLTSGIPSKVTVTT